MESTNEQYARHIQENEQKRRGIDYNALHKQLHDEAKHLKGDFLKELITFAGFLRARQGSRPYCPTSDERPEPANVTHEPRTGPHGQGEGFQGTETNPVPLDSAFPENQHSTYADDEPTGDIE